MLLDYSQKKLQPRNLSPFYGGLEDQRTKHLKSFQDQQSSVAGMFNPYDVTVDPQHDYGLQALKLGSDTAQLNYNSALNSVANLPALAQQTQTQTQPRMRAILRALGAQESGNNYSSVNKDSGALGRWQVMPANVPSWSQAALGHSVTPQQFLNNPQLQNQIVRNKFRNLLDQYGLQGALSTWYSGSPTRWNEQTSQGAYPSVHDYVLEVLRRLGLA